MHSALYVGRVSHRRYTPREHAFRYELFLFMLDLDEIDEAIDALPLCSSKRPAPVRFLRREHLGDPQQPLKEAVRDKVAELGGPAFDGGVRLLTHLRYFGYGFNPVSFYFCFDRNNRLAAILAEVNNTPWGEQHCYLIPVEDGAARVVRHRQPKAFHVSPFMDLDMEYEWAITPPGERLAIHIKNHKESRLLFDATLSLERRPLSARTLYGTLLRFPWMTARIIGAIYFQALRLWLKRIPLHRHPKPKETPKSAIKPL